MKLSFSTRGWQSFRWEENIETAEEMRFSGIELYNPHLEESLVGRGGPFHKYGVAATMRDLKARKLQIPCSDTSCDLSSDGKESLHRAMQFAHDAQVEYVSAVALTDHEDQVRAALDELLPAADALGVTLLMKTSGIYADTGRLRLLMDEYACDDLAALWDMPPAREGHDARAELHRL